MSRLTPDQQALIAADKARFRAAVTSAKTLRSSQSERLARFRDCAERGLTIAEIAKEFGISECRVYGIAREHSIPLKRKRFFVKALPAEQAETYRFARSKGLTRAESFQLAGINP